MSEEENKGAVPPKVKLKINKPGTVSSSEADNGPATIKIKPIKKTLPKKPLLKAEGGAEDKPKTQTIQLKEPVDTSSVKVELKPISKKSETSRIPLGAAVPKPLTLERRARKNETIELDPVIKASSEKSKTSRISLDAVLSGVDAEGEGEAPSPVVPKTSRPKTVKLKRPVATPKVTPAVEPSEEGISPTRKKTIKAKRPAVSPTPQVPVTPEAEAAPAESTGPKLRQNTAAPSVPYIADRFANIGAEEEKEDNPHWIFAAVGVLACIVMAVTIYSQVAQFPTSGLSWIGKVIVQGF